MDQNRLLSIILPVYNVEKYLHRSVESLLQQTIDDFEIILVDDGSTDSSGTICDEYAEKYPAIVKVVHKENGGVSTARNAGLDIAQGKWIGFVDPDDYVEPDMYEFLYRAATEAHTEIAACSWCDQYADDIIPYQKQRYNDTISKEQAIPREVKDGIFLSCNKIFYYKCIMDVRYKEGYVNGEDRLFTIQAICNANKITYRFEDKYHYCHRKNSAGTKKFTPADYKLLDICEQITEIFKQYTPNNIDIAHRQTILACWQLMLMMDLRWKKYPPYGDNILAILRKNLFAYVIKNKETSFHQKIVFSILAVSPKLYAVIKKVLKRKQPAKKLLS